MEMIGLFKYKNARKVFDTLLKYPKRNFTIRELAKEAKVPFSSVWRLIKLWEPAGIIEVGKLGRNKVIRYHESAFTRHVSKLLKTGFSPQRFTVEKLKEILKKDKDIKKVYLFGSVARGEETLTSDIDIAMYARKGYKVDDLMFRIARKYGMKLVPLLFETEQKLDRFLKSKKKVKLK